MISIASLNPIVGSLGPGAMLNDPDTTQRFALGTVLEGVDPFGIFGYGKFIYLQVASGSTITVNQVCVYNDAMQVVVNPTTTLTGRALCVAKAPMAAGEYGWFQLAGSMIPAKASASVAAGAAVFASGTAGSVAASGAGLQIIGATSLRASTATRVITGTTRTGSKVLKLASPAAGVFLDQVVSGTGVPASSEVTAIGANGGEVTMSESATASGTVTLTFTNTGYIELAAPSGMFVCAAVA